MITRDLYEEVLRLGEPARGYEAYFDINGTVIRVASPASETIKNLQSFFHPYIASKDATKGADELYELCAVVDPVFYDGLKASLPSSPDDELTTNLRHDLEYQLRCFHSEAREITILEDAPLKLFYVIAAGARATRIIATTGSRTQTGLLRIIRAAWMLGHDGLIVHGCVLEKKGRGIIIAGEKHSGKTTSLLNLCSRKNYNIVANDRLLLEFNQSDESLRGLGVPTVIKLRLNTVKPFPELQHLINLPLLGVSDLANALNVKVKREVDVTALVFLSYDEGRFEPAFRSLSQQESYEMLASHLFSRREYDWVRMLKIGEVVPDGNAVTNGEVLKGVSAFHLTSNESHLEDAALLLDSWCQVGA